MQRSQHILMEESVQIAWDYLERTGQIDDAAEASRFLANYIEAMIAQGTISRLALSNRAITAYMKRGNSILPPGPTKILLI